ncbi:MAG: hypothetical protein OHK0012_13190 [Synechococcales cyanobacterium]
MITEWPWILAGSLRVFGVFWVAGGGFTLYVARQSLFLDQVLETLSAEKEDRLTSYFLAIGGGLTLLSGMGLALLSRWVFLPLLMSLLSQGVYFYLKHQRWINATTEDARADAKVAQSTRNAFVVSCVVTVVTLWAWQLGLLR